MNDSNDYQFEIPRKPGKYCCPRCSTSKADKPLSVHYDGSELYYKCHRCDYKGKLSDGKDNGQPREAAITVDSLAEYCGLTAKFLHDQVGALNGRDCVEFPYRNPDSSTFRIKKRLTLHNQKGKPRFVWDEQKDRGQILYGIERLGRGREAGYSFLAEGESDCWVLWFNDLPAIGVSGSQAFKDSRDSKHFDDIPKIYLIDERDDGGKQLTAKLAASGIRDKVYRVTFEKFSGVKAL